MAMAKHTPGPWKYKHGDICGPDDTDGDDLVLAAVGVSYGLRSSTYSIVRKGPEMEANANLIVAAPDMLEALKAFEAHYPMGVNPFLDDAFRSARAAISKAEGQS